MGSRAPPMQGVHRVLAEPAVLTIQGIDDRQSALKHGPGTDLVMSLFFVCRVRIHAGRYMATILLPCPENCRTGRDRFRHTLM